MKNKKCPKIRFSGNSVHPAPNEKDHDGADSTLNKIARFEQKAKLNNISALDHDLTQYENRFVQKFAPTETVSERILDKN